MRSKIFAPVLLCLFALRAEAFIFNDLRPLHVGTYCAMDLEGMLEVPRVRLEDEKDVVVTAWNTENVGAHRGRYEMDGIAESTGRYRYLPSEANGRAFGEWKFAAKQAHVLRAGEASGLPAGALSHFVVAAEVESVTAADRLFNTGPLAGKYRTYMTRGNDERRIDLAFAVRADLDVMVRFESHRDVKWFDPVERKLARVFTRDLPALVVQDRASGRVLLVLIGQHAKSMRDRAGGRDYRSNVLRAAQLDASAQIVAQYRSRFGTRVPIVMAGDFNTDVRSAAEIEPIKDVLADAFDVVSLKDRATHSYHPAGRATVHTQMDACFVSSSLQPFVRRALVLPEYDRTTGHVRGRPISLEDRIENYASDHRAVAVVIGGKAFRENVAVEPPPDPSLKRSRRNRKHVQRRG